VLQFPKSKAYVAKSLKKLEVQYFFKSGAISACIVALNGLLNFLTRRTLSFSLPEVEYGFFFSIFSFYSIFIAVLDLGLTQSATILIGKYESVGNHPVAERVYSSFFVIRILILLVVTPLMIFFSGWLANEYFHFPSGSRIIQNLAVWFSVNLLMGTLFAVFDAMKKPVARNLLLFGNYAGIFVAIQILAAFDSLGLQYISAVYALAALLPFVVLFAYARSVMHFRFTLNIKAMGVLIKEFFSVGKWIAVSSAGLLLMANLDTVLLTQLRSYSSVAVYNVALPVMQIMLAFFLLIPQIATPLLINAWYQKSYNDVRRVNLFASGLSFATMTLLFPFVVMFAKRAIVLMFGIKYSAASGPAMVLLAGVPFYAASQIQQIVLNIAGKQKAAAFVIVTAVGLNLVLNFALISIFDTLGAAIANLLSYMYIFTVSGVIVQKTIKGKE